MSFLKNLEEYVIFVGSARILNGFKTNQESTRFCSRLRKTINKKEFAQRSTELCTEFKEKKKNLMTTTMDSIFLLFLFKK